MSSRLRYRPAWLAVGWILVLVVIVLGNIKGPRGLGLHMDWVGHVGEFVILMTWFGGLVTTRRQIPVAVALFLLGVSIEIMQLLNIFRHFDLRDIAANTVGILAGLLLVRTFMRDWCYRVETRFVASKS